MPFYDLESNIVIAKKIIDQYINTKNTKMQVALLAIITNILSFSLNENKEKMLIISLKAEKRLRQNLNLYSIVLHSISLKT